MKRTGGLTVILLVMLAVVFSAKQRDPVIKGKIVQDLGDGSMVGVPNAVVLAFCEHTSPDRTGNCDATIKSLTDSDGNFVLRNIESDTLIKIMACKTYSGNMWCGEYEQTFPLINGKVYKVGDISLVQPTMQ